MRYIYYASNEFAETRFKKLPRYHLTDWAKQTYRIMSVDRAAKKISIFVNYL